jgi:hypothetical protein
MDKNVLSINFKNSIFHKMMVGAGTIDDESALLSAGYKHVSNGSQAQTQLTSSALNTTKFEGNQSQFTNSRMGATRKEDRQVPSQRARQSKVPSSDQQEMSRGDLSAP